MQSLSAELNQVHLSLRALSQVGNRSGFNNYDEAFSYRQSKKRRLKLFARFGREMAPRRGEGSSGGVSQRFDSPGRAGYD